MERALHCARGGYLILGSVFGSVARSASVLSPRRMILYIDEERGEQEMWALLEGRSTDIIKRSTPACLKVELQMSSPVSH